jgi:hypothetical protein
MICPICAASIPAPPVLLLYHIQAGHGVAYIDARLIYMIQVKAALARAARDN